MIKDSYDVIVVGAGPGGSAASKALAELGHSVLLLEKRQEIGSPKRCAEGLSEATAEIFGHIPQNCISAPIKGARVFAPNGESVTVDFGANSTGVVVERKMFDKWLAGEASRKGAKVIADAEVTGIIEDGEYVTGVRASFNGGKEKEIKAKVVVAADGVETTIARKAGMDTHNKPVNVDSGFQYEMCNLKMEDTKKIYLFLGNDVAPRGYIWIFPKGKDTANVGIGVSGAERTAKEYLDDFIESRPEIFSESGIVEVNSGGIPVGGFLDNMVKDGLVIVGDAGHQVNPIHGGGIKEATLAGRMAADVISKCIKNDDVSAEALSEYNRIWWKERGESLKRVEKLRTVTVSYTHLRAHET